MKKNTMLIFTKILYGLFIIGTIITLFVAYKDIESEFVDKFIMIYLFLLIFMLFYIPIITIVNLRNFRWVEIRGRVIKSVILFIIFAILNYGVDFFFRPSKINLLRECINALGVSLSVNFIDITFFKRKNGVN